MAVILAEELPASGGNNSRGYFDFTRTWIVQTDDPLDGPYTASDFPGHPTYGDGYGSGNDLSAGAVLYEFRMEPVPGQQCFWRATAKCSNEPQDGGESGTGNIGSNDGTISTAPTSPAQSGGSTAPADRAWTISFGVKEYTELMTKDVAGTKVTTKAGQPIPLEVTRRNPTISITKWSTESAATLFAKVETLVGSINDDSFLGFAPGKLMCTEYKPTTVYENGSYIWQVNVTLELNRKGWNPVEVTHAGTVAKAGGGELKQVTDASGQPISSPVLLDADGYQAEPGTDPPPLEFEAYEATTFTGVI
jgi:hypothetical protein